MMFKFGRTSKSHLITCHQDLQEVAMEVIEHWNCSVLEGHREEEKQEEYFEQGLSEVQWPDSKHNKSPSEAIHLAPWYPIEKIPWEDRERFRAFGGFVMGVAAQMGIALRWGGRLEWKLDIHRSEIT